MILAVEMLHLSIQEAESTTNWIICLLQKENLKKLAELNIHYVYKVNLATPPHFSLMPIQLLSITEMIITFKNDLSLRQNSPFIWFDVFQLKSTRQLLVFYYYYLLLTFIGYPRFKIITKNPITKHACGSFFVHSVFPVGV